MFCCHRQLYLSQVKVLYQSCVSQTQTRLINERTIFQWSCGNLLDIRLKVKKFAFLPPRISLLDGDTFSQTLKLSLQIIFLTSLALYPWSIWRSKSSGTGSLSLFCYLSLTPFVIPYSQIMDCYTDDSVKTEAKKSLHPQLYIHFFLHMVLGFKPINGTHRKRVRFIDPVFNKLWL